MEQTLVIKDLSFGFLCKIVHSLNIPPPALGWDNEPNKGSKTEVDDLERCHQYWNRIRGSNIPPSNLCSMWNSLSQVKHKHNRQYPRTIEIF